MTLSLMLIGIAILVVLSVFLIARSQRIKAKDLTDLSASIRTVDLEAFQNLMSPHEEEFLRANLTPRMFRRVQRRRLLAAVGYVSGVAGNAVILMRIGGSAQDSFDPEMVSAGRELGEAAAHLRIYAILVLARLCVSVVFPGVQLSPVGIADQYQDLCHRVSRLSRIRVAHGARRLSATL
jgi:hypothetical protein